MAKTQTSAHTKTQISAHTPSPAPRRVLLVEDDPEIVALVRFRLEREGYDVLHVADGEQALQQFESETPFDLVILDVMLPYRDGFDLLDRLRANPRRAGVPAVMLSARTREDDVVRGLAGGADDYIAKPFRPAELLARIRKLVPAR